MPVCDGFAESCLTLPEATSGVSGSAASRARASGMLSTSGSAEAGTTPTRSATMSAASGARYGRGC